MEIKEKWKTNVGKLTIGMETQAALNIIKEKKKKRPLLKKDPKVRIL